MKIIDITKGSKESVEEIITDVAGRIEETDRIMVIRECGQDINFSYSSMSPAERLYLATNLYQCILRDVFDNESADD